MKNDADHFLADDVDVIEIILFSLHDSDFLTKYNVASALWSKLIQLKLVTIAITDNNVVLRLYTYEQDRDVILNTYLDEVRNVFKNIQNI